ncbi:MAG: hypothetical protein K6F09_05735 [Clostridiales bacterium]|nr:hypothetical protein [Clostridiales bacterium]
MIKRLLVFLLVVSLLTFASSCGKTADRNAAKQEMGETEQAEAIATEPVTERAETETETSETETKVAEKPEIKTTEKTEKNVTDPPEEVTETTSERKLSEAGSVDFKASYIRTNGYHEDAVYPKTVIIDSESELSEYCESIGDAYDMRAFKEETSPYDASFFDGHDLVLILLEENSGSVSHEVKNVFLSEDGVLTVVIKKSAPEVMTCDMAEWHITVEVPDGDYAGANAVIKN